MPIHSFWTCQKPPLGKQIESQSFQKMMTLLCSYVPASWWMKNRRELAWVEDNPREGCFVALSHTKGKGVTTEDQEWSQLFIALLRHPSSQSRFLSIDFSAKRYGIYINESWRLWFLVRLVLFLIYRSSWKNFPSKSKFVLYIMLRPCPSFLFYKKAGRQM